jgi:uncharacterized membrane protein
MVPLETSDFGSFEPTYKRPPAFPVICLIIEVCVGVILLTTDHHWKGWIITGLFGSVTAVLFRVRERSIRSKAGTKYIPSQALNRCVAILLLVALVIGAVHMAYAGREIQLRSQTAESTK